MKPLQNYLKQAIDTEFANAYIRGQVDCYNRFANLIVRVNTYKIKGKKASENQKLKLLKDGCNEIAKNIPQETSKFAIIARMDIL